MNKATTIIIAILTAAAAQAQLRWNTAYQQYIDQYKDLAIEQMKKYRVPASITLAQGLLESGAGQSRLAKYGNNHFGIKCHDWTGQKMYADDDALNECFRVYDSPHESFEDHSRFLSGRGRYSSLFALDMRDYKAWAHGLKAAGYATNPQYAARLIDIIELYKLYQYDNAKTYDKYIAKRTADPTPPDGQGLHPIYLFNKNYYLKARSGDTFRSIAEEVGIPAHRIAAFNERDVDDPLLEGEFIYLKKKQKRAPKDYQRLMHEVKAGESMYYIAQYYGIQLKSLYKMNNLSPDYNIQVGARLKLR